ncbi:hypothetical protein CEXT_10611 [Caerostris extrusa]|uniref:Uncharacterized protein n=1 Tax=Caerostris extrusa TaxID=172846 RepID=A0AAV4P4T4_CAEEX|nr:hypothetical protein CEXT_10611 [Caerostris extrusa]
MRTASFLLPRFFVKKLGCFCCAAAAEFQLQIDFDCWTEALAISCQGTTSKWGKKKASWFGRSKQILLRMAASSPTRFAYEPFCQLSEVIREFNRILGFSTSVPQIDFKMITLSK